MYSGVRNDECLICEGSLLKGLDLYHLLVDDCICFRCRKNLKPKLKFSKFNNYRLLSFYSYNDEIARLLIRYKDLLDKPLAPLFLKEYMWLINYFFKGYKVILIPSSKTLEKRRGFNHLQAILKGCKLEVIDCLEKTDSIQRFSHHRSKVYFTFKESVDNLDKVIIFDDVITSGSSMLEALRLLAPISKKIVLISIITNRTQ
ncbi:MAG: ComF family protein [Erysipelothrix sp.]|nr:ComF family protein [Erysipelothrix sp.]